MLCNSFYILKFATYTTPWQELTSTIFWLRPIKNSLGTHSMGTIMAETPRVEGLARQTTRCGGDGDDGGGETVTLATSDIRPEAYLTLAVWLLFCMGDSLS